MKQGRSFLAAAISLFFASVSCSQTNNAVKSEAMVFEASTPCGDKLKAILGIPFETKCDFVKWKLTLKHHSKTSTPSNYALTYTFGLAKQGTRGFTDGAKTVELHGRWTTAKGITQNPQAIVYQLKGEDSPVNLYFLKAGENLLQLLDTDKRLMVGTAAWSYTLNRINPISSAPATAAKQIVSTQLLPTDSDTMGVFTGRTPCNDVLRELNAIPSSSCQGIKCKLLLYQDVKTHQPSTFLFYTIYVGAGDTKYSNTGKWTIIQGTKNDPRATIYRLHFDNPQLSLQLLKADDNILFVLDNDENFLVGNGYTSYTLNRTK